MKAGVNAPGYNNALGELDRWLVETVVAFTKWNERSNSC